MLVAVLASLAVFAILQVPVSISIQGILAAAIFLIAIRQIVWLGKSSQLIHHHEHEHTGGECKGFDSAGEKQPAAQWLFQTEGSLPVNGALIQAGYRSAALVVLVLQSSDNRWHRIPIWADSVSASQFSYLHVQLAFNANVPQTRSIRQLLPFYSGPHHPLSPTECIGKPCCTTLDSPMNKSTRP